MIKKVLNSIKKDGFLKTIKKIYRFLVYKIYKKKNSYINIIDKYVDINQFENIIIFENNFGWNKIMRQRPQQIANSIPKNTLMFYHSHEDADFEKKERINKINDNLILIDLGYFRDVLLEKLYYHNNKYVLIYSTDYIPYDRIKIYEEMGYNIIYDYVDDINYDLSGELYDTLLDRHKKILNDTPFIICTSEKLYNSIDEKYQYKSLITNGVDYDHFKVKEYEIPDDLVPIKKNFDKIICYYGALASWFDYDLIKKVAIKNPKNAIILLGIDYDNTLEKSKILDLDNIFYLGKKGYDILPSYGCNSDIFIIPFLINEITLATSPVKIFEYMAMEKPIVTTAMPECKKYKSVLYSQNSDEFVENIDKAIKLINEPNYKKILRKEAMENTWESKSAKLIDFINKSKYNYLQESFSKVLTANNYERIIIWRSPFGWNVPLFQRPQHIARQLAKQKCLVLYEVTKKTDAVQTFKKIENNLYLVNFENNYLNDIINELLKKVKIPKYLDIYSTNWMMSLDELKRYIKDGYYILYEYIDDISPDLAGTDEIPSTILDKYNYALKNENILIVTTAQNLYDDVLNKRGSKNVILSCNGVDYKFYQEIDKNFSFEKKFLNIINNGKKNVCYYGALASWFDYDLIKKINEVDKYNIILIGVKYDNAYDNSNIDNLKNVHFLGAKDYSVLKNYANKMDVLIIPFVINSITKATSPLKLFEYMALHKPIVTTNMDECHKYKSVLVANDHDEFIKLLKKALSLKNNKDYNKILDKEARENDWSKKGKEIIALLKENEKNNK